ncbi:ABC transporter permease [Pseudoroseomonas deserti]|uniref:ABC transporter permease n=1 Tax=Teichococcus deserti TaxID=1817963 RepID=A0A1V2H5I8_9PROT|nr:ABC transporter permease [Pseudoroseomonas deserti]ONG56532.1 ABC transporter permease [Pseudoroseomonas deserti]
MTRLFPWIQTAPLALVLAVFLLVPVGMLVVVSFYDYDAFSLIPAFVLTNYQELFTSPVTWQTYLKTIYFAGITWAVTLGIGFWIAYHLAFVVQNATLRMVLFILCTVPFWTSNLIRMIAWVPFLGRNGILNSTLIGMGAIEQPLEFLLFSDFSVILAFVHLYTLFMVVPIFNTMMRIDRRLLEAARDAGAGFWQTLWCVILPLTKPGIGIGSIFVVVLVMGDFATVRLMSGGQSASVGLMISNQYGAMQYPAAAANAVGLLLMVLLVVAAMLRIVDIRREL